MENGKLCIVTLLAYSRMWIISVNCKEMCALLISLCILLYCMRFLLTHHFHTPKIFVNKITIQTYINIYTPSTFHICIVYLCYLASLLTNDNCWFYDVWHIFGQKNRPNAFQLIFLLSSAWQTKYSHHIDVP